MNCNLEPVKWWMLGGVFCGDVERPTPYRDGEKLSSVASYAQREERARFLARINNDRREIERLTAAVKGWEGKYNGMRDQRNEAHDLLEERASSKDAAIAEASMLLDRAADALKKAHAA